MRNRIIPNLTLVLYLILIIIPNPTLVLYLILIKNQPSPPTVMLRTSISEKKTPFALSLEIILCFFVLIFCNW